MELSDARHVSDNCQCSLKGGTVVDPVVDESPKRRGMLSDCRTSV